MPVQGSGNNGGQGGGAAPFLRGLSALPSWLSARPQQQGSLAATFGGFFNAPPMWGQTPNWLPPGQGGTPPGQGGQLPPGHGGPNPGQGSVGQGQGQRVRGHIARGWHPGRGGGGGGGGGGGYGGGGGGGFDDGPGSVNALRRMLQERGAPGFLDSMSGRWEK
jgi:hypothetical protein